jgi:hypothetical protein
MSLGEFRAEQQRISRAVAATERVMERCQTEYEAIDAAVEEALSLCANAHALYLAAPPDVRRMLNQAVFSEPRVRDDLLIGSIYTTGYEALRSLGARDEQREGAAEDDPLPADLATLWDSPYETSALPDLTDGLGAAGLVLTTDGPSWGQGSNYGCLVGRTGFEPVTSSVSGKRAPAAPTARDVC